MYNFHFISKIFIKKRCKINDYLSYKEENQLKNALDDWACLLKDRNREFKVFYGTDSVNEC